MPTSPATSITAVRARLKDASLTSPSLSDDDIDAAIQNAVKGDYSRHRPLILVRDITGNDKAYYKLTGTVSGWVDGTARVESVECPALDPAVAGAGAPEYLEAWEYELYQKGTDVYLRLKTVTPSATEVIRLSFTGLHTHDAAANPQSTIPPDDLVAVLDLAAALSCAAVMGRTAAAHDGIIKSGISSRGEEQERWGAAYRLWLRRYQNHMGIDTEKGVETSLASVVFSPGIAPTAGEFGGVWMTHRRRRMPRG